MNSSSASTAAAPAASKSNDQDGVSFKDWKEVLERSDLPADTVKSHRNAIFGFLRFLKEKHRRATIPAVHDYLKSPGDKGQPENAVRAGLQWFFVEAKKQAAASATSAPAVNFP